MFTTRGWAVLASAGVLLFGLGGTAAAPIAQLTAASNSFNPSAFNDTNVSFCRNKLTRRAGAVLLFIAAPVS